MSLKKYIRIFITVFLLVIGLFVGNAGKREKSSGNNRSQIKTHGINIMYIYRKK